MTRVPGRPLPHVLLDLGEVLVGVDNPRLVRGLCELYECSAGALEQALFEDGVKADMDTGRKTARAGWLALNAALRRSVPFLRFARTYCDIFTPLSENQRVAVALGRQGHARYLLSNTCPLHLAACRARWPVVATLEWSVVSFEAGIAKPDPRFFEYALRKLALPAADCVFADDRADNCAAAESVGIRSLRIRRDGDLLAGILPLLSAEAGAELRAALS